MGKTFSMFINFAGNCREAVGFYTGVFQAEVQNLMTYGQMPEDPEMPLSDVDREHIMYSSIPIFGCDVMFCDIPSDMPLTRGDNISLTLSSDDPEEIKRIFAGLAEGGEVLRALEKIFWSELYGMVQDKYGVIWQLSYGEKMEWDE